MQPIFDLDALGNIFLYLSVFLGAVVAGLWMSMVVWTARDIRSRTRDRVAQMLSALLVLFLNIPGLLMYIILRPNQTLDEKFQHALEEEALLTHLETNVSCPGCGSAIESDWQICPHCHTRLRKPCEHCDRMMELPWRVCPYCGHHASQSIRPKPALEHDHVAQDEITQGNPRETSSKDLT